MTRWLEYLVFLALVVGLARPAGVCDDSRSLMRDFNIPGRSAAIAANGMVATSAPMATLAGLDVLRAGGNAMDAAIAAVAMQSVVEPQSTGVGCDCFVLYSKAGGLPVALNGSGRAPAKAGVEWYAEHQIREISTQTAHAVTIPGAVDACLTMLGRYGTKTFAEAVAPTLALLDRGGRPWYADLAKTIRRMIEAEKAAGNDRLVGLRAVADFFYRGPIAREIDACEGRIPLQPLQQVVIDRPRLEPRRRRVAVPADGLV